MTSRTRRYPLARHLRQGLLCTRPSYGPVAHAIPSQASMTSKSCGRRCIRRACRGRDRQAPLSRLIESFCPRVTEQLIFNRLVGEAQCKALQRFRYRNLTTQETRGHMGATRKTPRRFFALEVLPCVILETLAANAASMPNGGGSNCYAPAARHSTAWPRNLACTATRSRATGIATFRLR